MVLAMQHRLFAIAAVATLLAPLQGIRALEAEPARAQRQALPPVDGSTDARTPAGIPATAAGAATKGFPLPDRSRPAPAFDPTVESVFDPTDDAGPAEGAALAGQKDEGEDDGEDDEEIAENPPSGEPGSEHRYTGDLSDAELERRWLHDPASLGSISVGLAAQGRLLNAVQLPDDPAWVRQRPDLAWGAQETIEGLAVAFRAVRAAFPGSAPGRMSHIGNHDGGRVRPHRSHQSGRDADIGLFYRADQLPVAPLAASRRKRGGRGSGRGGSRGFRASARDPVERRLDPARNWVLVKALVTQTDVQVILLDRRLQAVLRDYAERAGEDRTWLDRVFQVGHGDRGNDARRRGLSRAPQAIVQHARRHRDHFHVRFYAPRSQELGRRVLPLLAKRPEQNLALHTVRRGQTLGHLARTYRTTVRALAAANRLTGARSRLHAGQQLLIPLRGPCTSCPLPPPVVVPPRCLPPSMELARRTAQPHNLLAAASQKPQRVVQQPAEETVAPPANPPILTRTAAHQMGEPAAQSPSQKPSQPSSQLSAQPSGDPTLPEDAAMAAGRP
jgi:LysM repeat protein/murein endopeptidase